MKRTANAARRQLALSLDREIVNQIPEETQQAVIAALADLLLEALGEPASKAVSEQGGDHESEDNN
jgi:hypothetical protein